MFIFWTVIFTLNVFFTANDFITGQWLYGAFGLVAIYFSYKLMQATEKKGKDEKVS